MAAAWEKFWLESQLELPHPSLERFPRHGLIPVLGCRGAGRGPQLHSWCSSQCQYFPGSFIARFGMLVESEGFHPTGIPDSSPTRPSASQRELPHPSWTIPPSIVACWLFPLNFWGAGRKVRSPPLTPNQTHSIPTAHPNWSIPPGVATSQLFPPQF